MLPLPVYSPDSVVPHFHHQMFQHGPFTFYMYHTLFCWFVFTVEWLVSVKSSFQKWHDLNLSWIKNSKKLLIVYYEELALNPEKELIRMLSFLGQPVNMERIRCATQTYPLRNRTHLDAVPFYPPIVRNYVTSLNNTLIDRQARPLPSYHE